MAGTACDAPAAYRPRRARDSPLYRLAETHHETFKQVYDERFAERYGFWRAEVERTLWAFLDCGIEEHGFARVRCDECRREYRVALWCKRRGFCPSCHAKRAVLWAEWLATKVLAESAACSGSCLAARGRRRGICAARGSRIDTPWPAWWCRSRPTGGDKHVRARRHRGAMVLCKRFRGRGPSVEPLLERRGLK